jgi:hypothetical protein
MSELLALQSGLDVIDVEGVLRIAATPTVTIEDRNWTGHGDVCRPRGSCRVSFRSGRDGGSQLVGSSKAGRGSIR